MTPSSYFTYAPTDKNGAHTQRPANPADVLVSVIIPIYNAAPFLDQALDSVQAQTHKNLEIICLNDGSTDNSLDIIRAHAARDERIVIIDKQNQGYGATCNRGLDEAHGEWIAILEPDDWIEPGMYRDMLSFASTFNEPVEIIKTPYWRISLPDTPRQRKLNCSYKKRVHVDKQPFVITDAIHLLHHHPSIWSAIYRKSFLNEHGIRFKPIPGAGWADNPFLVETLCRAQRIVYLDQAYYCYREETKEKTRAFHRNSPNVPFDRWNEMLDIIESLGITDERILCAHYSRGFMYMSGVIEENDPDDPAIHAQLERMFNRMNPELVYQYPRISPGCRRLYAEVRGLPKPNVSHLQYASNLLEQGVYNLRNIGIYGTLDSLGNYLIKYRRRTGGR
ncbi:glycosyltransferase family 2 protein [Adlercreutzia sp. ZJ141]|uniref:glycosyltransferase family 2 protein n=1 Tax=Adlercreutzia sp. ZJ141 TaxID=2709406 RepID=UPI0013EAB325|nr:glycosyltransferase [Adlercreutzia sp. ZJ141]